MIFRLAIPFLLIAIVFIGVFYTVITYIKSNYKRNNKIEFNDLTNDSLLKQVNDNLTVIKYCMIFFVVVTIFAIAAVLIAYIIYLLS